ncbi:uncharacterized protein LOC136076261 [Hydra vulgaris]|uniref:Uncharacterized protein LOC136076261 n=1 Tax=Hydra vulgaris TaxID=6087 RepID=A0ABM4BA70_HYDVU
MDFLLEENWPKIGQGNHSDLSRALHVWCGKLSSMISSLTTKVGFLEAENKMQQKEIDLLKNNNKANITYQNNIHSADVWAGFISKEKDIAAKEKNAALFAKISKENNEKNRILNNIIISGLTESVNLDDDNKAIDEILTILKVSCDDVKVKKRLKKKNASPLTSSISSDMDNKFIYVPPRPPLVLIEFKNYEKRQSALANARELKHIHGFTKVYVRPDQTENERIALSKLHAECRIRNNALPNSFDDPQGRRLNWGTRDGKKGFCYSLFELKCLYFNPTSLDNKWDEFQARIASLDYPHIIAVTETWFTATSLTNLENYTVYLRNRTTRGGGVAIYVRKDIHSYECEFSDKQMGEQIWCQVSIGNDVLLIGCIYRQPFTLYESDLQINKSIKRAKALIDNGKFTSVLLVGDFNHSDISWCNLGEKCKYGKQSSQIFLDTINDCFLSQFVTEPTFINNTLDLVLSDDPDRIYNVTIGPPLGCTQKNHFHNSLLWDFRLKTSTKTISHHKVNYIYDKGDYNAISEGLKMIDWPKLFTNKSADESFELFKDIYISLVEHHIPKYNMSFSLKKRDPKWFNSTIKAATKEKFRLFMKLRCSSRKLKDYIRVLYKKQNRLVKKLVADAVLKFENEVISACKSCPKKFYSYINSQKSCKSEILSLFDHNGVQLVDKMSIASCLNNQFFKAFSSPDTYSQAPNFPRRTEIVCSPVSSSIFSCCNIEKLLFALDSSKGTGNDGIHPRVLKSCSKEISVPLSLLFIKSFDSGQVPSGWKLANITPIFKKGQRTDPGNYRPISLTSAVGKLMEKIMRDVMTEHLVKHNLLSRHQHGFVKSKSCITNLLEVLGIITEALSDNCAALLILLDFTKAFDRVSHSLLYHKLAGYGFGKNILAWLKDFLENRKQRVVLGNFASEWMDVQSGVPQGSVIGPLLFLLFINDMPELVKNSCKLFADDSQLVVKIKTVTDLGFVQKDIDILCDWSRLWCMEFSINKCKVLKFHGGSTDIDIPFTMVNNNGSQIPLEDVSVERTLGVLINNKLKWSEQISHAILKANSVLGLLRRTFKKWNPSMFVKLYTAYVRPILEYCAPIWCPFLLKDIKKLELVQRRATKRVPQLRNLKYEKRLANLGLSTLAERRTRGDVIQFFKIYKKLNVVNWQQKTNQASALLCDGPAGHLRGAKHKIEQELTKNTQRHNFFINRVVSSWNTLPASVVASNSVNEFKNNYDKWNRSLSRRSTIVGSR